MLAIVLGCAGSLGCLVAGFRFFRRKRLIDDTPTSKVQGVFIGLVELKGSAESDQPITSYLAGISCVQYLWQVEEHWSRTVTETYTDAQGRHRTRRRTQSGWTQVAGGSQSIPFYLRDDTGVIRIIPEGASIRGTTVFNEACSRSSPLYFGKGPVQEVPGSTHRRRFRETAVPLHSMLYVIGQSRLRDDIVAPEIAHDKGAPIFVISTGTEKQVARRYALSFLLLTALGLAAVTVGAAVWSSIERGSVTVQPIVIAVGGFLGVLLVGWIWSVYNSLINLRNMVQQGRSQVDVQFKRRHDLIPNIARAVEAYRTHESETQRVIAAMRTQMEATLPGEAGPDPEGITPMLKIIVERYPELQASESFLRLHHTLIDTEQRIALARDYLNSIATFHNDRLSIIPDRFVAAMARLRPQPLLTAAGFERAPVRVDLAQ